MSSKQASYAASTFSQDTTFSYEKQPATQTKTKRSLKEKAKSLVKELGTSPFQYDDETEKATNGWVATLPPSRT